MGPSETASTARDAAREARSSPVLRMLARGGYAANGVVHLLIGAIVIAVAFGAGGESDQAGAFKAVAAVPLGFLALWLLAGLLAALGLWHLANALVVRRGSDAATWGVRTAAAGQAVVFVALASIAGAVALGARPDADETAQDASRGVLTLPGGPFVLGLVGLGIGIGGIAFVVMGVRRSYRSKVDVPDGSLGAVVDTLGIVGFLAKGAALVTIGVLLVVAAVKVDADSAGGLDGALRALVEMAAGPVLVATIGTGLIAYGVFCGFRAVFARL